MRQYALKVFPWAAIATLFVATLGWAIVTDQRATRLEVESKQHEQFSQQVLSELRDMRAEFRELNGRLSRIEGALNHK